MIIRVSQRLCFFCCKDTLIIFQYGAISIILGVKTDFPVFKGSYCYLNMPKFRRLFMFAKISVCIFYLSVDMLFCTFRFPKPEIKGRKEGV